MATKTKRPRTFACPVCDAPLKDSHAIKLHQGIDLKLGYEPGFVYYNPKLQVYGIITDAGGIETGQFTTSDYIHTRDHYVARYSLRDNAFEELPVVRNSRDLEILLEKGILRPLGPEESLGFEETFRELMRHRKNIPTTVYRHLKKLKGLNFVCP